MLMKHRPLHFPEWTVKGEALPLRSPRKGIHEDDGFGVGPLAQPSPLLKTAGPSHDYFAAAVGPVFLCVKGSVCKHTSSEAPGRGWVSAVGRTGVSRGNGVQGPPVVCMGLHGPSREPRSPALLCPHLVALGGGWRVPAEATLLPTKEASSAPPLPHRLWPQGSLPGMALPIQSFLLSG